MENVFYEGDKHSGPIDLPLKKDTITALMNKVFAKINIEQADRVVKFELKHGHPAYVVFWDFAYNIHSNGQRWILMGSSSD